MEKEFFLGIKNNRYEGKYKNNRREGFGVYYFDENNYFEGKWINNLPHGEGKIVKDGKTTEGLFRFGIFIQNKNNKKEKNKGNIMNIKFKDENIDVNNNDKKIYSFK